MTMSCGLQFTQGSSNAQGYQLDNVIAFAIYNRPAAKWPSEGADSPVPTRVSLDETWAGGRSIYKMRCTSPIQV